MPAFGVEVDTAAFEGAMQKLRDGVHRGFIDPEYGTLAVQTRLLSKRCQDFTPPRNAAQGNAAVMRDLTRVYFPQDQSTYTSKTMQKIVRNDNREDWNAAAQHFDNSHGLRNTQAIGFSESLHKENRDFRGRVRKAKYGNIGFVTLGPEAQAARAYMRKVRERVGWAKGGWNMGILAFGGQISAQWISRHSINRGKITDGRGDANPFIAVLNDTGWARDNPAEGERIVRNAVNARIRDMHAYATRMCLLAAEKARLSPMAA